MKNNRKSSKTVEPKKIKEQWGFYFNKNKDASTALNLALKKIAPIKDKPNLARITLRAKNPPTDNPTYQKEREALINIEGAIAKKVKADNNSIHVGRHTPVRNKFIYFYCSDTDVFNDSVSDVLAGFADYEFEVDFHEDKEWKIYFGIYPTERQFQSMGNLRIIEQLLKMGDDLSEPREVDHTIFFKSKADRKRFLKKTNKQGFAVNAKFTENFIKGHPYGLVITRMDKVDLNSVDEYVLDLWDLTKQCKGFYDGWATWSGGHASPPVGFRNDVEDYPG